MKIQSVGIDSLSFYTPNYYLGLDTLAKARGIDPNKFYFGLGQNKMAIAPPNEDVVTMAANAAERIITKLSPQEISSIQTVLFATESGIDFSKSAGIYVHRLLKLPNRCRVVELKQACFAATSGLQLGMAMLQQNPQTKILLLAADIARYNLESAAESSQGAGAVAMLLSAEPKLLKVESGSGFYTEDVNDFWRPNYRQAACVDGKYSCEVYLKILEECWQEYSKLTNRQFADHQHFCYHIPLPKLVEKAHARLAKICGVKNLSADDLIEQVGISLKYSREIGNCYTASLYLGILSLLENNPRDLTDNRLGLYSYGSGCSGEYFSGKVVNGYNNQLYAKAHTDMLKNRQSLSYDEYIKLYNFNLPEDGSFYTLPNYQAGKFRLTKITEHKRIYE